MGKGNIIDGKKVSCIINHMLQRETAYLKRAHNLIPSLVMFLVGDDPASHSYAKSKEKRAKELGINSQQIFLPERTSEQELLDLLEKYNNDDSIDGILVQLPLPFRLNKEKILQKISIEKDIDGFHISNIGKLISGIDTLIPCTPHGIWWLLQAYGIEMEGKDVVIIGRSNIVGRPLANLLSLKYYGNATVTLCHSNTKNLKEHTKRADILISAVGKPLLIKADMVKEGATVIDVGINRVPDITKKKGYRICGDVDFDEVRKVTDWITPVPGGVGVMTVTMLMYNVVEACLQRHNLSSLVAPEKDNYPEFKYLE